MLRLVLRSRPTVPLEVEGVTPDAMRTLSLAEIERLEVFEGNRRGSLADFFTISGEAADELHEWEGDLAGVHWIGAKMKSGRVAIHGNVGRHVGSEMAGGEIHIHGSASDWLGAEMHGGLIHVRGSAGHQVGCHYRGSVRGMTNGTILITGDAGDEIGCAMRRGLIAVGRSCGDVAGFGMLAGSILVFGKGGARPGAGMKRGTLAFFGDRPPLLPSFRHACQYRPENMALMFRHLKQLQFSVNQDLLARTYDLYNGDFLNGGRGEVLIRR